MLTDDPLVQFFQDGLAPGIHPVGQCDVVLLQVYVVRHAGLLSSSGFDALLSTQCVNP